jgi:hypothetical protein
MADLRLRSQLDRTAPNHSPSVPPPGGSSLGASLTADIDRLDVAAYGHRSAALRQESYQAVVRAPAAVRGDRADTQRIRVPSEALSRRRTVGLAVALLEMSRHARRPLVRLRHGGGSVIVDPGGSEMYRQHVTLGPTNGRIRR